MNFHCGSADPAPEPCSDEKALVGQNVLPLAAEEVAPDQEVSSYELSLLQTRLRHMAIRISIVSWLMTALKMFLASECPDYRDHTELIQVVDLYFARSGIESTTTFRLYWAQQALYGGRGIVTALVREPVLLVITVPDASDDSLGRSESLSWPQNYLQGAP